MVSLAKPVSLAKRPLAPKPVSLAKCMSTAEFYRRLEAKRR